MGMFSWMYSNRGNKVPMKADKVKDSYMLIPYRFKDLYPNCITSTRTGEEYAYMLEPCYEGYGRFNGVDVYDAVADWNRDCIPDIIRRRKNGNWTCNINESDEENLLKFYNGEEISCEKRWIGIMMACYDNDNFALEYPIKIVDRLIPYEMADASLSDPNQ